jgi:uncharacterized protein (TIGR00725 family)
MGIPMIGIIGMGTSGGSEDPVPAEAMQLAEKVGEEIARRGGMTLSGGEKGVMNAVSKGARQLGGLTVGVSPRLDRLEAGPYLDVSITTGLGTLRNLLNVRAPDTVVMINGGFGTLNELLLAYQDGKPCVVFEGSGNWSDRVRGILLDGEYLDERRKVKTYFAHSPTAVVELAIELSREPMPNPPRLTPPEQLTGQRPHIGVLTPGERASNAQVPKVTLDAAEQVGREIATRGGITLNDGGGSAQEANSYGARAAGGLTVGLLPSLNKADANPYIDVPLRTGLGEASYPLVVRASDAQIVIGGDSTTLNQLCLSYYHRRPAVVVEHSGGLSERLRSILYEGKYLDWRRQVETHFAASPAEAVKLAFALGEANLGNPTKP